MKNLYQPASWLFYILAILIFFFIGASIASISGMAEKHGLSGGAMVVMVGAMSAMAAWFIALFVAYKSTRKTIANLNKLMLVVFVAIAIYFVYKTKMIASENESTSINSTHSIPLERTTIPSETHNSAE